MKKLILTTMLLLAIFCIGACTNNEETKTPTALQPDNSLPLESTVSIVGDTMTIDDGTAVATVIQQANGYLANHGDFNVLYQKPEYNNDGQVMAVGFGEWTSSERLDVRVEFIAWHHQSEIYTRTSNRLQEVLVLEIIEEPSEEQYQELYEFLNRDKSGNSITNNADGYVLSALLEQNFDQMELAINIDDPEKRPEGWVDWICALSAACTATKCWFGALLNTVCGICVSIDFGCLIYNIFW